MFLELSKRWINVANIAWIDEDSNGKWWVYFTGEGVVTITSTTDKIKLQRAMDAYGK